MVFESDAAVALATRTWGEGEPRVLLVHGITSHGEIWWQVGPALAAKGYPCLAVDLRGHGASPRAERYGVSSYAGDLWALRPSGGWDLVVGHSLGGLVATAAAGRSGAPLARRLLLIDPVFALSHDQEADVLASRLAEHADPPAPQEVLRANPRWVMFDVTAKLAGLRQVSRDAVEKTMRENSPWEHTRLLTSLRVPTLVLGSDPAAGAMFDPALGAAAAAANPLISYRMVAESGHSIQRDDPAAVIAAAGESLSSVQGG